jgi:ADP-ribosylglycohydrolase
MTGDSKAGDLSRAAAGSLLGTAIGDAVGLASEGLGARRQSRMFPSLDRYGFLFGRGMCSDDTEHACMTAQALMRTNGDARLFGRLLGWKLRWWMVGLPAGIGLATLRAIVKLWMGFPPHRSGVWSAGNGPAMRAPLIGVCHGGDPAKLRALVETSTRITHTDPKALDGALAIAVAAHLAATRDGAVDGAGYLAALAAYVQPESDTGRAVAQAVASAARGEPGAAHAAAMGCERGVTGYMLHAVPAVIHAWLTHQEDYRGAIETIVRLGGDTDTTAAILGGIVGAHVGPDGIPAAWRAGLMEWPRSVAHIRAVGERAGRAAAAGIPLPEVPLFVPGVLVRNALFMVIVLAHGFRRLLPPY